MVIMLLTLGLALTGGHAQAKESKQQNTPAAQQADKQDNNKQDNRDGGGKQARSDDQPPTITLTAPTTGSANLYPAAFNLEATVTFPGKAESRNDKREGVEIEFLANGQKFAEAERAPYRASYTPPQAGRYTLTARIRYGEGKRTILSNAVDVISDLPPVVALTAPAANTVQTAPATFTLSANAAAPIGSIAKVEFYNGATLIGTATSAPYTTTWANVPYGTYSLTAKATDNYGFSTTSSTVSVTSNASPTISITTPANNAVAAAPGSFTLIADAADVDGTIAKVEFYNGTALLGTATTAPYNYTWNNVTAGTYAITAKATDNYGASTTSTSISVIADAPPTVNLTAPANNAVATAPGTFTLTANATSSMSSIAKVEFYNGTTLIGTATTAPYSTPWNNVPAGGYSLTAIATDGYGIAATSAPINIISNAPPVVSLIAPANNTVSVAPGSFTLTANAADADGTIAKVEFFNGTTLIGTATAAPYNFTWANIPAGSYSLTAVATDNLGATTTSTAVAVISNQAPTVSLTSPAMNAVSAAPGSFTLNANAADVDGTITKVEFYNGTTLIGTATAAPYSFTWTNIPAGSYTITAKATDNLGAQTTSVAVSVTSNASPTVSLTAPAANSSYTTPANIALSANATDPDGTIAKVEFYANSTSANTLIGAATVVPYSVIWNNAPAGNYTITAIATDNLGAQTTSAATGITVIAPPVVNLTGPANNTVSIALGTFTLSASASSAGTIAKVEFYAGTTLLGTATSAPYSYTWSSVPAGSYSLTAIATDGNGASTTSTPITIIADALPSVSLTSPAANATATAPGSFTLTASASSSTSTIGKVEFYANNSLIGMATVAPYTYTWSNVPVGIYTLTAVATDALGTATTSAAVSVTVKTGVAQAYYIHTDQLDTPRVITDTAGNKVWEWQNSDPFGNNMPNENPSGAGQFNFNLRFPGQYFDKETGLHQNHFRDYDPANGGRYIKSDPIGLAGGSFSTYTYAANNPLTQIDPLGLYWLRQPWQTPGVVGRPGTPVPPGGPVSEFIEQHVSAGYTFGEIHDSFVDVATRAGIPDLLANIPSMIPMFFAAQKIELLRTLGVLKQPTPPVQPNQCK